MDNDFEIELQDQKMESSNNIQLPTNFLSFGEIEPDDVKVYIKQDVYKALEKYALDDTEHERGTIILGDFYESMGKIHVIISNYIEAKYTDASASTLTFTHETWNYVYEQQEKLYPDKKIVGWQHTHPNYGIFLSNYDLFIHENFFNLPFQIAYVIDPIQNIRGFFQWKNGKIEKLKGYYIYDELGIPVKIEQTRIAKENSIMPKVSKSIKKIISLLCAVSILLSYFVISLSRKFNEQMKMQETVLVELNRQNANLSKQKDTITELQEQLYNESIDNTDKTTASELIEILENHEISLQNLDKLLSELKIFAEEQRTSGREVAFYKYSVASGDTLYSICRKNKIDYDADIRIILALNGINDANQIYTGQTILLPCYS